ncbi:MAG: hypothetical protein Q9227_003260 [Pyrenula ochraceoflavens]
MRTHGNTIVNRIYNPRNIKPSIPLDVDQVDSAVERYIRQKYQERSLADGKPKPLPKNDEEIFRSSRSSNESPPPLPPKKGRLFGFSLRATSSAYPLSKHDRKNLPIEPTMDNAFHVQASPLPGNKPSQVFGASIGGDVDEVFEAKLVTLKEMGFPDDRRNATVLRGLNGNLEKTVESLCRLGEGSRPNSQNPTPVGSARNTPMNSEFPETVKSPTVKKSTNPFDQPKQGEGFGLSFNQPSTQNSNSLPVSPTNGYNPFGIPPESNDTIQPLQQSFQGLHVSRQLFPHSTGGYPSQAPQLQQPSYQQSLTPPVPANNHNPFFQPSHPQQPMNPFFNNINQQPAPTSAPANPFFNQAPFLNQNTVQSPQNVEQQNQNSYINFNPSNIHPSDQSFGPVPNPPSNNPFGAALAPGASINSQQQFVPQMQPSNAPPFPSHIQQDASYAQYVPQTQQPLLPQATGRMDKGSILALYNYPQLAPPKLPTIPDSTTPVGEQPPSSVAPSLPENPSNARRSVTMPAAMSRNPFLSSTNTANANVSNPSAAPAGILARHSSRESTDLAGLQSGRHSPDAFASLSARFT